MSAATNNAVPNGWERVRIGELGEIVGGGTPSRNNVSYWNGAIPWVTPSEITRLSGKYLNSTTERISQAGLVGSAARLLPENSIVVTTRATLGEAAIAAVPLATNQGFKNIIPNPSSDPKFTYYAVKTLRREMERLASGTTFLEISKSNFERITLIRPQRDGQERVAMILDTVDAAIEETESFVAKLKRVRVGLLHDLLTRGLDENGELRDPVTHPEQFQDSILGLIPKEWALSTLRDCLTENPQNGIYKPPNAIGRGALLIGQTSITEDRSLDASLARRAEVSREELNHYGLSENDILISRVFATLTGVGQPALVPLLEEPAVYESNMMRLRVKHGIISAQLVFHWMKAPRFRALIITGANLSNQASVNQLALNSLPIGVPKLDEQARILKAVRVVDDSVATGVSELGKLVKLRAGLMADLLSGRIRVGDSLTTLLEHQP